MGYLFKNIGQLAGFLANQGESRHPEKSGEPVSEISFRSVFDSSIGCNKINTGQLNESDYFNDNIEFVERTFIDGYSLKVLIEKQRNIITLEISSDKISRYLDDLSLPAADNRFGSAIVPADFMMDAGKFGQKESANSTCRITFNASDLFNKSYLPVDFGEADGHNMTRLVEVTALVRLIGEYPDPIRAEIEIIPAKDDHHDINELKLSFKFDLRNLFINDTENAPKSIEGLISLSAGQLSKDTYSKSRDIVHNNNESPQKKAIIKADDLKTANESRNAYSLKEPISPFQKISLTPSSAKNHIPHGDNGNRENECHIVLDSSSKIESAGADEFKSLDDNNPSALSKFPVGSNGASEKASAEGKEALREKIIEKVNHEIAPDTVYRVYLVDYVLQQIWHSYFHRKKSTLC